MQQSREAYLEGLAKQVSSIQENWGKLIYFNWIPDICAMTYRTARNIQSTSSAFSDTDLAEAAESLELMLKDLLTQGTLPTVEQREEIGNRVRLLKWQLDRMTGGRESVRNPLRLQREPESKRRASQPIVYILGEDPVEISYIAHQIERHGYKVVRFDALDLLEVAYEVEPPAAIVADLSFSEGSLSNVTGVAKLKKKKRPIPIVFISSRMDISARLIARRSGGDAYLMKPVDVASLVGRLDELITPQGDNPYRVLVVDDDPEDAGYHSGVLKAHGFKTQVITNAFDIMQEMVEFEPDLVLLDLNMPQCSGMELVGLLRQEEAFANIPVVFLSREDSREVQIEGLRQGADDFLCKPVQEDWLVAVVSGRIRRSRTLGWRMRYLERRDPVTGFYNRDYFMRRVTRMMRAPVEGRIGFLFLRLDRFAELRQRLGVMATDRMLSDVGRTLLAGLDADDLVSRFSDHGFGFCVTRPEWAGIVELAERLKLQVAGYQLPSAVGDFGFTASIGAGLLESQQVAALVTEVIEAADLATKQDGNRVQLHPSLYILTENSNQRESYLEQLLVNANAGRIFLLYQPIVPIEKDGLERYETLLRITNREGEDLPIGNLVRAAEQAGVMGRVDRAVFRQALAAAHIRLKSGRLSTLFVKVSAASLDVEVLTETVQSNLEQMELPGETVVLMLPTAGVLRNLEEVKRIPPALHQLGCGIGLEYFGEKVTDLQLLDQINVDYIKFHPRVIKSVVIDESQMARLRFMTWEARNRGVQVIAGFVEDAETLARVSEVNPDFIQGNFVQEADRDMAFDFLAEAGA